MATEPKYRVGDKVMFNNRTWTVERYWLDSEGFYRYNINYLLDGTLPPEYRCLRAVREIDLSKHVDVITKDMDAVILKHAQEMAKTTYQVSESKPKQTVRDIAKPKYKLGDEVKYDGATWVITNNNRLVTWDDHAYDIKRIDDFGDSEVGMRERHLTVLEGQLAPAGDKGQQSTKPDPLAGTTAWDGHKPGCEKHKLEPGDYVYYEDGKTYKIYQKRWWGVFAAYAAHEVKNSSDGKYNFYPTALQQDKIKLNLGKTIYSSHPPKFQIGDLVEYNHMLFKVTSQTIGNDGWRYDIERMKNQLYMGITLGVPESELSTPRQTIDFQGTQEWHKEQLASISGATTVAAAGKVDISLASDWGKITTYSDGPYTPPPVTYDMQSQQALNNAYENFDFTLAKKHRFMGGVQQFIKQPKEKSKMAKLISTFKNIFMSEPEKSFRKAGILEEDGTFTKEGCDVFALWLLKKFGDEFKTDVVDKMIEEQKEK